MKIITIFVLLMVSSISQATCAKPNGNYVGTVNGQFLNSNNGVVTNFFSAVMRATFTVTGAATVVETGKSYSANGRYTSTTTIPAIGTTKHVFNTTTCSGSFVNNAGYSYVYVVSNSGAKISGTYYGNDNTILMNSLVMEKI
jgi:hypothetical protein